MKLSDAIEAGAALLKTTGPTVTEDCYAALASGLAGRVATRDEKRALYWDNEWGIAPGSDLEMWMRGTVRERYHWSQVLKKLRAHGA
jgi:hypothetical protein